MGDGWRRGNLQILRTPFLSMLFSFPLPFRTVDAGHSYPDVGTLFHGFHMGILQCSLSSLATPTGQRSICTSYECNLFSHPFITLFSCGLTQCLRVFFLPGIAFFFPCLLFGLSAGAGPGWRSRPQVKSVCSEAIRAEGTTFE